MCVPTAITLAGMTMDLMEVNEVNFRANKRILSSIHLPQGAFAAKMPSAAQK